MEHKLPELPYAKDALAPGISAETIEYHYGKHHKAYVDNLNKLILGTEFEKMSLEATVKKASGAIFNNAAQDWNHSFYWNCLSPKAGGEPTILLANAINKNFGSFSQFKENFTNTASNNIRVRMGMACEEFRWYTLNRIFQQRGNPLKDDKKALLTCDVWEHAYYIDYRNARAKYVESFWNLVNWKFVEQNFK